MLKTDSVDADTPLCGIEAIKKFVRESTRAADPMCGPVRSMSRDKLICCSNAVACLPARGSGGRCMVLIEVYCGGGVGHTKAEYTGSHDTHQAVEVIAPQYGIFDIFA